jgi:hypothetical protein
LIPVLFAITIYLKRGKGAIGCIKKPLPKKRLDVFLLVFKEKVYTLIK